VSYLSKTWADPTPYVFSKDLEGPDPLKLLEGLQKDVFATELYVNDLEPPAFELMPKLKEM